MGNLQMVELQSEVLLYIIRKNHMKIKPNLKAKKSKSKGIKRQNQKDKQDKELINNTIQGKIAENMFIDFIDFCQPNEKIKYLSYDEFRNDEYKNMHQ